MKNIDPKLQKFIEGNKSCKLDYDLKNINWFQVGGKADLMFRAANEDDLQQFLKVKKDLPLFTMGVGSNIIIRDKGFRGCVIRLGRGFTEMKKISDTQIEVGAANLDVNVSLFAKQNSLAGAEFLSGIPGTIGGALAMNAGAYNSDIYEILDRAYALDLDGNKHEFTNEEMGFSYRKINISQPVIFTHAIFNLAKGNQEEIAEKIEFIQKSREDTQPIRNKTGGSTFKNPEGKKAWQLVDQAGCRGMKINDAQISEKHCNFMINNDQAKASDLEELGEKVRKIVKEKTGVELQWEIKIIGEK